MDKEDSSGDSTPESPQGASRRDGTIDFTRYSVDQLHDFEASIDRDAYPHNFQNLLDELARRSATQSEKMAQATCFAAKFTSRDGLRGWFEARLGRLHLYGSGSLDIRTDELILQGWQRTWLGMPVQVVLTIASSDVQNVARHGSVVRLESQASFGRHRRFEIQAESDDRAATIAAQLPQTRTRRFYSWSALQDFNAHLNDATPTVWVTPAVVILNLLSFAALAIANGQLFELNPLLLVKWGSNYGPATVLGQWWRLFTASFLHGGIVHLLVNMWVLWNAGRFTERLYGNWAFLFLYAAAAVLGGFAAIAWDPAINSVGASGAIFGVLGAFLIFLLHPRTSVPKAIARAHWISTAVFVVFSLANGMLHAGVDNASHVGGLIAGICLGWLLARPVGTPERKIVLIGKCAATATFIVACVLAGLWQAGAIGSRLTIPQQYWRAHPWYPDAEAEMIRTGQQMDARAAAGNISNEEIAQRMEQDILPFWKNAQQRLKKEDGSVTAAQRPYANLIGEFVDARVEWTSAVIEAAKDNEHGPGRAINEIVKKTGRISAQIGRLEFRAQLDEARRPLSRSALMLRARNLFAPANWKCVGPLAEILSDSQVNEATNDGPVGRAIAACTAQRMFQSGDFDSLEAAITRYQAAGNDLLDGSSRLWGVYAGLNDLFEYGGNLEQAFVKLSDWRRDRRGSVNADVLEAMLFTNWAWQARGSGYAKSVTPQAWALFGQRMEMAAASLRDVKPRAQDNPLWYQLSIAVSVGQSTDVDQLRKIYDEGYARFPSYMPLHGAMLRALLPRWQGSYEAEDKFINQIHAQSSARLGFEMYARLYSMFAAYESDEENFFDASYGEWNGVKRGFEDMTKRYPQSYAILNGFAYMACRAKDAEEYRELRARIGKHIFKSAWPEKWSLEACDRQIASKPDFKG